MVRWLAVPLVLAGIGCRSFRPSAPLPPPETEVRVSFAFPRDIAAQAPSGERTTLRSVTELQGRIIRAQLDTRLDSVRILLGSARGTDGSIPNVAAGTVATVPRDVSARVEQKSLDGPKTAALVVIVALSAAVVGLFALMTAYNFPS